MDNRPAIYCRYRIKCGPVPQGRVEVSNANPRSATAMLVRAALRDAGWG